MDITIKNFQSIEDLNLKIPEGSFTCLVGPSNIGKSAIRRAIECVLYNNSEASYIRLGTKQCSVEIVFDNGTKILWKRNEKSAAYEINGTPYTSLSKTVPQPILDMGFKELEVNKEKLNVQVASQFDNVFLLKMTGSKVTDVFSNLGNLNKIINANKACTSDLKSNRGRLNIRKDDLISIKDKIVRYDGLDEQRHLFDTLKDSFTEIKKIKNKKEQTDLLSKKLDKSVTLLKIIKPIFEIKLEEPKIDIVKFKSTQDLYTKLIRSNNKVNCYLGISQINVEDPNISLEKFILLKNIFLRVLKSKNTVFCYTGISQIENISCEIDLEKFNKLKIIQKTYDLSFKKTQSYSSLKEITALDSDLTEQNNKLKLLKDLLLKLNKSKTTLVALREKYGVQDTKYQELEAVEKELHKEFKVCPLCNKEF